MGTGFERYSFMGEEKMTHYEFRKCLKTRKIIPFQATKKVISKEINAAEEVVNYATELLKKTKTILGS